MYCPKCGAMNAEDATFCQSCGASLKAAPADSPPTSPTYSSSGTSGTKASFKISSAFSDAIALVRSPVSFMNANRDQDVPLKTLIIKYVAVLAAIPFVATLIGDSWYYRFFSIFGGLGFGYIFGIAVLTYILDVAAVFVVGYLIWKLAPSFGTTTTQLRATRMAAYIFTPAFLISIFNIIPFLGFLTFLGVLYGLYIMYLGLPILMNTPKDKVIGYVIVTVIAAIVVYAIIGAIIGAVIAAAISISFGLF
jgi:hypothetical protein